MKQPVLVSLAVVGLVFVSAPAQEAQPAPASAANALVKAMKAMQEAKDPSAVVDAFADAQEIDKNSAATLETYIRRMAEFGLADLVRSQVQRLIELDPKNPLGWGMQAYTHAVKGEMDKAMPAILKAVQTKPVRDPFVLSVAGQLLAWYDQKGQRPEFDAQAQAIEDMRRTLADKEAFADGYTQASEAYTATAAGSQPGKQPTAQAPGRASGGTVFAESDRAAREGEVIIEEVPPVVYEPYPVYTPPLAVIVEPVYYDRVILVSPFFYNRRPHHPHHGFFFGFNFNRPPHNNSRPDRFPGTPVRLDNGATIAPLDLRTAVSSPDLRMAVRSPDLRTGVSPAATMGGVLGSGRTLETSVRGSDLSDRFRGGTVFGTRSGIGIRGDAARPGSSSDRVLGPRPLPSAPLIVPRSPDSSNGPSGGGEGRMVVPRLRTDIQGFVRPDSSGSSPRGFGPATPGGRLENTLRSGPSGGGRGDSPGHGHGGR